MIFPWFSTTVSSEPSPNSSIARTHRTLDRNRTLFEPSDIISRPAFVILQDTFYGLSRSTTRVEMYAYCLECGWERSTEDGYTEHEISQHAIGHFVTTGHAVDSLRRPPPIVLEN